MFIQVKIHVFHREFRKQDQNIIERIIFEEFSKHVIAIDKYHDNNFENVFEIHICFSVVRAIIVMI